MSYRVQRPLGRRLQLRPGLSVALTVLVSGFFSLACRNDAKTDVATPAAATAETAAPAASAESATGPILRGDPIGNSPEVTLEKLLANPDEYAGKTVRTQGTVSRACSTKGCWMQLSHKGGAAGTGCRVTFKDYGFFVPTDSAGSEATVEGVIQIEVVKPSRVKHFESEGAVFPSKNADGSANELRIVATGVELRR